MRIIEKVKEWYRGKYVPPPDPMFVTPHYEQPLLARALGTLGRFWLAHWKWVVTTVIALIAIFRHFAGK